MKATLFEKLSNEKQTIEVKSGQPIKNALPDFDLENSIIIVNGKVKNQDYVLQEEDTVTIRLTPGLSTTAIIIISAVVAVGAGIVGGVMAYRAKLAADRAKEELEKVKKLTNKNDIDNRPFLRGASNTLATGNSQPYIIGRHLFTPYLLCKPFYHITGTDGAEEYTYAILECGFNKQILQSVSIDDIKIKTFNDTAPQEGDYSIDSGVFAEDGKIEISQGSKDLTIHPCLNYKIDSTACNDEIPYDSDVQAKTSEYLTYTLNPYAKDVEIAITFPYGLYAINDKGDKIETKTTITPQYSLDGGKNWKTFTFMNNNAGTNDFKRDTSSKELRYTAFCSFDANDYNNLKAEAIYIRVRNSGNKNQMIKNQCYVLYYQSLCFDPEKSKSKDKYTYLVPCRVVEDRERAFCTIIGLKLKASKINEDKLKKINIITHGVARTWNGTKWNETKTATRNPAAWALEIETSPAHPASRRDDSELDLESFGEFYEYCEANGYKFDWVITQNTKKDDVLTHILEATGACIYYDIYGRRAIAMDKPQENALAVYNPQNIISIQNKKTFGRRTDGLRIKYVNSKDDLYQEDTYLVMREGHSLNQDSLIKDLTVTGITTFEHIVKYARRLMAIEVLRPKTTIIETGNEGVFYTPFSKVLVQDDSLKIGIGKGFTVSDCVWKSGLLKKIYTKEELTFDPAKRYGIIVNCFSENKVIPLPIKVEGTGKTNELTVLSKVRISADGKPETGNIFSFGELDIEGEFTKVTTPYIINQIKRSEKGFNLELVNYDEAIYKSGVIPDYRSNISQKKSSSTKNIPADSVTHEELSQTINLIDGTKAAQEAANEVVHGIHFTNVHRIRDMELSLEEIIAKMDDDARQASASISMSEDEILLRVDDMERELVGLVDIQAGQITALVEGGGAQGKLSLSLELPVMIDAKTRAKFVQAANEEEVAAVYAQLDGTSGATIKYAIKGNASNAAVKTLWDKAVKAALIASQIDLSATQINMAAERVVITGEANHGQTLIDGGKIRAALIDVEKILAKNIKIKTGGSLCSQNFNGTIDENGNITSYGSAGWAIDNNGRAVFSDGILKNITVQGQVIANMGTLDNVRISGNTVIEGNITIRSGPLTLSDDRPQPRVIAYNAGDVVLPENLPLFESHAGTGTYKGISFDSVLINIRGYVDPFYTTLTLYRNGNIVFEDTQVSGTGIYKFSDTFTYTYTMSTNAKTFKLSNLPTEKPGTPGIVYNKNGTLMIS